jgi:hypothetical protein
VAYYIGAVIAAAAIIPLVNPWMQRPRQMEPATSKPWQYVRLAPIAIATTLLNAAVETAGLSFIALYASGLGWTESEAMQLVSTLLVGAIVLQLPIGWLADRVNPRRLALTLSFILRCRRAGLAVDARRALGRVRDRVRLGRTVRRHLHGDADDRRQPFQRRRAGRRLRGDERRMGGGALIGPMAVGFAMGVSPGVGLPFAVALGCGCSRCTCCSTAAKPEERCHARAILRCIRGALIGVVAAWLAIAGALAPGPAFAAATNYQGLWWNAPAGSESGWGINFSHQGDTLFATWFTYDANGKAWWLIAELHKSAPGVYSGGISTVTGPPFNAVPFSPGNVVENRRRHGDGHVRGQLQCDVRIHRQRGRAGEGRRHADQDDHATVVRESRADLRLGRLAKRGGNQQLPGSLVECASGLGGRLGINFSHQGNIVFATWFTYDAAGKPFWLIALLQQTSPGVYAGEVSTVTGPPFNAVPFPPSAVETVVGTATVTFADANNATFSYTVNGIAQTKAITRQVFAEPGTVCHTPVAEPTGVGTPNGPAVSGTIGPDGGSITSDDGRITLTIPPGALDANVQFTIQPITNRAPGGVGEAYRLLPDGQTFAIPAQIAFKYDDQDLAGSAPEALGIAFQDELLTWQALRYAQVDTLQRTVVGSTSHLSDWSLIRTFRLVPAAAHVDTGEPRALALDFCRPLDLGGITSSVSKCVPESGDFLVTGWAVNGVPGGNATIGTVGRDGRLRREVHCPREPADTERRRGERSTGWSPATVAARFEHHDRQGLVERRIDEPARPGDCIRGRQMDGRGGLPTA